eukprot:2701364-Karenia_brevis.AAC.1
MGHAAWAFLVRRPSLALFDSTYKFIKEKYDVAESFPSSVRHELRRAQALLPLIVTNLAASWSSQIFISDASPTGIGILSRQLENKK